MPKYNWKIVLGLVIGVPLSAVVFGVVVNLVTDPDPHPMKGKCVQYFPDPEITSTDPFVTLDAVSCDAEPVGTQVIGRVTDVMDGNDECPAGTDRAFVAQLGGDNGTFCVVQLTP